MDNRIYGKYKQRIVKEGIVKSLLIGIMFGCLALVVTAFLSWFFDFKPGLFIAIAAFVVVTAAVTPLFYFLKFRPTVKEVAQRVDALGLEERMLTMTELEGDDSFMAQIQREDTVRALGSVDHMLVKIAVSAAIIVPLTVCCVLGLGMTTVSSLHYAGVIPSGLVTLTPDYVPGVYTVVYSVEEGGEGSVIYWTGDWSAETPVSGEGDKVKEGENAPAVYAVPDADWVFVSWSDGYSDPYRQDTEVDGDIFVQAIFEPIDPDPKDDEVDQDTSGDSSDQQQEGQNGQEGQEGEPQEGDSEGDSQGEGDGEPSGDPGTGGAGSRDLTSQQIVDGETYYGDQFDDAYSQWHDRLGSDNNIPDDLKGHIEDYYGSIETGGLGDSGEGEGSGSGDSGSGEEGSGGGN